MNRAQVFGQWKQYDQLPPMPTLDYIPQNYKLKPTLFYVTFLGNPVLATRKLTNTPLKPCHILNRSF